MSALTRMFRKRNERDLQGEPAGKIYKLINTIAVIGLFLTVGIIVLMLTGTLSCTANLIGIIAAIAIACLGCILALPWIRRLESNEFKILSLVFIGLTALSCILWIISDIVIISQYKSIKSTFIASETMTEEKTIKFIESLIRSLNFLKVTTFLTIQFSVASFIATGITKFRKTMIPFQAIAYTSYGFVDFWISGFLFTFSIKSNLKSVVADDMSGVLGEIFKFNKDFFNFLTGKVMMTIFFLAVAYVAVSNIIIKKQEQRKMQNVLENISVDGRNNKSTAPVETAPAAPVETVEQKLEKLKNLLDKNLISQEEYDKKKEELLKDM